MIHREILIQYSKEDQMMEKENERMGQQVQKNNERMVLWSIFLQYSKEH